MKVFLICLEEEKERSSQLVSFLEKTGVFSETLLIKTKDEGRKVIENFTHVVVLSALGPGWIDFLAGFFCGSHLPILVFGGKAIENIPEVYAFCFKFFDTEDKLHEYLSDEYETFKKNEAALGTNKARQALLDKGVPITDDALTQCVAEGKAEEVSLFLSAGFSPDTKDKKGIPLLCISARNRQLSTLELLLRSGAQVNLISEDRGSTALIDSASERNKDMIKTLVKAGADVNIQSKDGQTALVIVVGSGDEELVEILVKAGADPDIKDALGVSARKYATIFGNSKMLALFDANALNKVP
ncbi:ankyrin repeat domain-containing protein [Treponema sp. R6D11]